jgi:glycosyltransferase involved in cell wall biosynthesis
MRSAMAKISVIIPCYNRVHLLGRAIDSVLNQTVRDLQLLIVDDASTDGTDRLVESYQDPRIEYIRHETNRGAAAARNTGLQSVSARFVAFLDSDDAWLEDKLEKQYAEFEKGGDRLGVVYTRFRKIDWRYEPSVQRLEGDIRSRILVQNCVGTASTPMLRRECFDEPHAFDSTLEGSEDWDIWIRLAQKWEFRLVSEVLVLYYPQPISLTADRSGALRANERLFRKHAALIDALDPPTRAEHFFYRGRMFIAHRRFMTAAGCILRALRIDPTLLGDVVHYLFVESARKVRSRIGIPMRDVD